jgi:hypothetical protein
VDAAGAGVGESPPHPPAHTRQDAQMNLYVQLEGSKLSYVGDAWKAFLSQTKSMDDCDDPVPVEQTSPLLEETE